jgi:sugar phosphate isomerase/epimerase
LKSRFSPDAPFGLGLRLSARDAAGLLPAGRLKEFRDYLRDEGLYVALINGFPYGPFHGTTVKANVYAPDWRDEARVAYTLDLLEILEALLPDGLDGGISTSPLSYKPWLAGDDRQSWDAIVRNVVRVAARLVRAAAERGRQVHLDIEPEPDCSLETAAETVRFFERHLFGAGAGLLATELGIGPERAREALADHVRVCFDCCHFAVEYEDARSALRQLQAAGIRIGRVQVSSALQVSIPADRREAGRVSDRLRAFADPVYLHQVVERNGSGVRRYPDLDEALSAHGGAGAREWRVHFHVPLFTDAYDLFGSTQQYAADVIDAALAGGLTRHLEIETYTWHVLPEGLKLELLESIAREYQWVLDRAARFGGASPPAA